MNLNDERPLWEILGLAIPLGTPWKQLRIGELKTLLALAVGNEDAILEGCDWIHHFKDLAPARRLVYRCIESMLNVDEVENYRRSMELLYGVETVRQAAALLDRSERTWKAARCTRRCWPRTTSCSRNATLRVKGLTPRVRPRFRPLVLPSAAQSFRSAGTLPPFAASLFITWRCSQMFIAAESPVSPV
jgi:hypothetical protein